MLFAKTGTVFSWGYNYHGQLGDSTTGDKWAPVRVRTIRNITQIAAGSDNGYALKIDGTVYAWGYDNDGRCGSGAVTLRRTLPIQVVGQYASTFLEDIIQITAGNAHVLALTQSKHVYAWGAGSNGRIGDGANTNRTRPVYVTDVGVQILQNVEEVESNRASSYAIKTDGSVWAWGYNNYGQLAVGDKVNKTRAVQIKGPLGQGNFEDPITIGAGVHHMTIANREGRVYAIGYNGYGQIGDGTTVNKDVLVPISMEQVTFNSSLVRFNAIGEQFQIEAHVDLGFNLVKNELENATYTYRSRDTSIAWVSPTGNVTAVKYGRTEIMVTNVETGRTGFVEIVVLMPGAITLPKVGSRI